MTKAILFDFDDTLVTTITTKFKATQYAGRKFYNIEITDETLHLHWGKPFPELMQILFKETNDTLENIIKNYKSIRPLFPCCLHNGAIETIEYLSKKYIIGIVTSSSRSLIMSDLKMLHFPLHTISYIQTCEDTEYHKPHPKVFDPTLIKLKEKNILKDDVVYIGDSLSDYYAARDAGLSFYGIPERTTSHSTFKKKSAKTINSLTDLMSQF